MKIRILLVALCAALLGSVCQPALATKVLLHGANAAADFGADGDVLAHLQSRYGTDNVTYMQGTAAAADGSSADGFDLVVISATLNSGDVRGKYHNAPIGVMNWEQALMRKAAGEFNMSGGGRTLDGTTQITITDPSHPLAAGLSGTVTVYDTPVTSSFGRDALALGATLVASGTDDPTDHAIFAADVGAALLGDGSAGNPATAAGRRTMFFLQDSGFSSLTPDGIALFNAATDWTASVPEPATSVYLVVGLLALATNRRRMR